MVWELWGLVVVISIPTWGKSSKHHWDRPYIVLTEKWSDQAIFLQSQTPSNSFFGTLLLISPSNNLFSASFKVSSKTPASAPASPEKWTTKSWCNLFGRIFALMPVGLYMVDISILVLDWVWTHADLLACKATIRRWCLFCKAWRWLTKVCMSEMVLVARHYQ